MRKTSVFMMILILLISCNVTSFADNPRQKPIFELYSVEGYYEDSVGNAETYSYHVPQIFSDTPTAKEINAEIAERFGKRVEEQFQNMKDGLSLWSWHTEWHSYWVDSELFLLISADEEGGFKDYAVYGYDFVTDTRLTNEMILEQRGLNAELYKENLREKAQLMFEDMYGTIPQESRAGSGNENLLPCRCRLVLSSRNAIRLWLILPERDREKSNSLCRPNVSLGICVIL